MPALNALANRPLARPMPIRSQLLNDAPPRAVPKRSPWGPDARSSVVATILIVLLVAIMVVPQGLDYTERGFMPTEGDTLSRIVWLVLLAGAAYILASQNARTVLFLRNLNPFLLLFVGLATLSILWSIEPTVTIRRVIRLFTMVMTCTAFTLVGWNQRRFQRVLRNLITVLLAASAIFVYTSPDLAIHHVPDHPELNLAWRGITTGKNILGSLSSAGFLLWLHAWLSRDAHKLVILGGAALAAVCLIMSRSSTSIMATLFATTFMLILLRSPGSMRSYLPYFVGIFATVILIYSMAVLHLVPGLDVLLTPITALTGKDLTFTGRTSIWFVLIQHIHLRPWLGTGYGAYWVGPVPTSPSYEMLTRLFFYPTEGHNGYLDVINDLGLVGGAFLFGYFFSYVRTSLKLLRLDRYQAGLYLTLLFRGFVGDMSESHWFSVLSIDFVIMTLATTSLTRSLLQARAAKQSAQQKASLGAPRAA
jgi:exopolysaccharide production protein ExoQ